MYNYGLIGDMSSAALVGTDGSIDWCCLPRFVSPSVFASILDEDIGGRFRIQPRGAHAGRHQVYKEDTNILETTFTTPTGVVKVIDFMPISDSDMDGKPDTNPAAPRSFTASSRAWLEVQKCAANTRLDTTTLGMCRCFAYIEATATAWRSRPKAADKA